MTIEKDLTLLNAAKKLLQLQDYHPLSEAELYSLVNNCYLELQEAFPLNMQEIQNLMNTTL